MLARGVDRGGGDDGGGGYVGYVGGVVVVDGCCVGRGVDGG